MTSRIRAVVPVFAVAVAFAFAPARATAQCMPDLLDSVPCCTPVGASLPVFPAIVSQTSKFVCFRDCAIQLNANLCVDIGTPNPAAGICGIYLINFKIKLCGGAMPVLFQGGMRAHYSRNWVETTGAGATVGVWRFLINGDLTATPFLQTNPAWSNPNVKPGCYTTFNAEYVSGYIDYAFDCTTLTWSAAWVLNHDCDRFHHAPGTVRPAPVTGFHPNRTWTFLGPGAGFVVDPVTTLTGNGPANGEAMRWNDWSTMPGICRGEERVNGAMLVNGSFCPCSTLPGAPGQYDNTFVDIVGSCGSYTRNSPVLVNPMQKRIGRWTNLAVFPGVEYVSLFLGGMEHRNACTGTVTNEFFEGVTTAGGYPSADYAGNPFGRTVVDLGSANKSPISMAQHVGAPHLTYFVLNYNLP